MLHIPPLTHAHTSHTHFTDVPLSHTHTVHMFRHIRALVNLTHIALTLSVLGRPQHRLQALRNSSLTPHAPRVHTGQYSLSSSVHMQTFLEQLVCWVFTLVLGEPTGHKHGLTFSLER